MAGIYIHIPFCKQRCTYCDFYTQVAPQYIPTYIDALKQELELRKNYITDSVSSVYFGGGTPSLLSAAQLGEILNSVYSIFSVENDAEITLEANPDDLSEDYLVQISNLRLNRLSIGVQSFDDEDLKRLNRRHTSAQAFEAVRNAQKSGFTNISIDLIYGLPFQTLEKWNEQLSNAFELKIQHISAYGLTYEEGTPLWKHRNEGIVSEIDDETMNKMYAFMLQKMKSNDFEAYEISNFSKIGFRSHHNSSYWKFEPYLGIGPSAHSFDGVSRQWNVSSIQQYLKALQNNDLFYEKEILSLNDRYNDYILVSLRTAEGADSNFIEEVFGKTYKNFFLKSLNQFIPLGQMNVINNRYRLTETGINISNMIISALMKV
ncbi:MAG: radical SAM family heme chaperone HemW [Paludibacter sp.]|nr:radical SAM family heme chaperone HemW [Paludibacter sp.]